ncbi:hypothetical protein HMPREF1529_00618 [Microbacterium sp. oral taxon 186 str. F0373]|jgi:uncharacterized protein (DUF305 family)|uniref:DUF305 domain-containing protein n=1 Tax=Microbacterium sp. oral taxon 186 TaxID=712383 RepID=UPI00034EBF7D|nr:DUF305 domain-containing protein [Microbacterium sp. oral taxon 186]EPD86566.1 hypothetical protein HMPREF1529_00618 [Microbacterium sp. oral taxon 186 str. F0373]
MVVKKFRWTVLTVVPLAVAVSLAGCAYVGGGSTPGMGQGGMMSPTSPSAQVNAADEMFVIMMIPHHEQAVEMSDTILGKDGIDDQVQALAQQIKDAQAPEIELMQSWLTNWGMSSSGDMSGMGHGDGMMSDGDMAALEAADGAEAARLFLEQMIVHHEGAIEMAQTELDQGANEEVIALAQAILDTQTTEIATMENLLTQN